MNTELAIKFLMVLTIDDINGRHDEVEWRQDIQSELD